MYTMTMTRSYLWVLLMLQLWPRPLAAAQSLRGTSDADADAKAELGGPAAVDAELDHRAEQVEEIDDARGRRTISQDMMSLGASNSIDTITIDQFHRDERGEGHSRLFPSPFQTRVIGGRDASEDVTSTVSLQDSDGNHFCGGSLVSKDCVLTAAHCTDAVTGKGQITAVIGRHRLGDDKEGERIQVRNTYMHPRYDVKQAHVKWEYDFALMCLMRPTKAHVEVVQLNKDPYLPRGGSLVAVVGWGDMDRDEYVSRPAETLQMANLRIVSNKACDQITGRYGEYSVSYHGFIHDDMMCAKNRKRDSCQGDSGGPLMYRGIQIGITSWGVGCNNRNFPGVYARVSSAYDWVQRNICIRSAIPDKQFDCERWRRNLGEAEETF